MKRRELHQSEIALFLKCGLAWVFRYVRGIKTPPSAALTLGSSVDAAVAYNLTQKIKSGEDLDAQTVRDVYETDFNIRSDETEWGDDDPGKQKDLGARLVTLHHEKLAPTIEPEKVQETFRLETDAGYDIGGKIDLIEKTGVVSDLKTSNPQRANSHEITRSLQLTLYDFAYESLFKKPSTGARYDLLIKKATPEVRQVEGKITSDDRDWLFSTVNKVHEAMEKGVALPAPDGAWWCSEKWCGYWRMCKGKNQPVTVEVPNTRVDKVFSIRRRR